MSLDDFDRLPAVKPIPRAANVEIIAAALKGEVHSSVARQVARKLLVLMLEPGMPCGHARAFFFENERGETGCVACDMWEDAFAK